MGLFIRDNGSMESETDSDLKCGKMALSMKGSGKTIRPTVRENSSMPTVMSMRGSG